VTNQPPKAGQMVDPRAYLWETKGSIQKWIAPPCWGEELTKRSCSWRANNSEHPNKLAVLPHLTIPTNLVDRRAKY
jgi:hypothetical protein